MAEANSRHQGIVITAGWVFEAKNKQDRIHRDEENKLRQVNDPQPNRRKPLFSFRRGP